MVFSNILLTVGEDLFEKSIFYLHTPGSQYKNTHTHAHMSMK